MDWYVERDRFVVERMKLDKFFTMFLDKFEKQLDPDKPNTPVWNLYKKKLKEYDTVTYGIKQANYWINKGNHV